ncbi:MAG: hypothetical protein ACFFD6_01100 [Candidatus Thorarchaeota archaeon]
MKHGLLGIGASLICILLCLSFTYSIISPLPVTAESAWSDEDRTLPWVEIYSGRLGYSKCSLVETNDSGFVIASTLDEAGPTCGRLTRVNSNGALLWSKTFGRENSVEVERIITCDYGGFATIGRSFGEGHSGAGFLWLVRFADNGTVLWQKEYTDYDWGTDIKECQDGGFIIAASDPDLIRTNASGDVVWTYTSSWYRCHAFSVAECSDGDFIFTGGMALGDSYYDAFLICLDDQGNFLWSETYNYAQLDIGASLIECESGGFAIAGESGSYSYYPRSFWLLRTDENGMALWESSYCVGFAESIVECFDGGFALAGTLMTSDVYSEWDAIIVRTDAEGNRLWSSTSSGPDEDRAHSVVQCKEGGYSVTGWTMLSGNQGFLWRLSDDSRTNVTMGPSITTTETTTTTITTTGTTTTTPTTTSTTSTPTTTTSTETTTTQFYPTNLTDSNTSAIQQEIDPLVISSFGVMGGAIVTAVFCVAAGKRPKTTIYEGFSYQ